MTKNLLFTNIVLLTLALCSFGCNNGSQLKGLVPVEGTVYYDGKPLEGASVKFYPNDTANRTAAALTDANGKFVLTTLNSKDGALPGEYKVSIMKLSATPVAETEFSDVENAAAREKAKMMKEAASAKDNEKPLIPMKYASPNASGLTASVPAKGVKDLKFELEK